jgi:Tfp pilus assembly protein PilW
MIKNEKGLTIVELLAALTLLSCILLLTGSILLFGQKQMTNQSTEIQNQSNLRLALSVITKEIRKAASVTVNNNVLTLNDSDVYKLDSNNNLTKNNLPIISNLQQFMIQMTGDQITITLADLPSNNLPQTTLSTTIYVRR